MKILMILAWAAAFLFACIKLALMMVSILPFDTDSSRTLITVAAISGCTVFAIIKEDYP